MHAPLLVVDCPKLERRVCTLVLNVTSTVLSGRVHSIVEIPKSALLT